jgi:[protein-PII] uridylyltransferase
MAVTDPSVLDDAPPETPAALDWPLLNRLPALLAETQGAADSCRALLRQAQAELRARFDEEEPVEALVRARARFTDLLLRTLWRQRLPPDLAARLALVAVGGYGRDELHPPNCWR